MARPRGKKKRRVGDKPITVAEHDSTAHHGVFTPPQSAMAEEALPEAKKENISPFESIRLGMRKVAKRPLIPETAEENPGQPEKPWCEFDNELIWNSSSSMDFDGEAPFVGVL